MFTKILTSTLLFLVAIGGFFVSNYTFANNVGTYTQPGAIPGAVSTSQTTTTGTPTKTSEAESKWLNEAIQAFNAILGVLTVIVSPAIIFAGWLLSPDWTSGDLFGLREPMHKMWIIVSNIIYFIYAILLIMIALATIFGKENFSYKSMLPKLALGILMVPFTWWFVQWTISLSTVVTASVINIPMSTLSDTNPYVTAHVIPKSYYITTAKDKDGKEKTTTTSSTGGGKEACTESTCLSALQILNTGGGTYSTLLIYAYQVFRIQDYKNIEGELNKIKTAGQILNNVLIGAIMFLVFGLLVMALIAMLLLRAIKLWMYAIFSPILTLHFVAGKELFGKSTEGFDLKEFVGLCFVPAVVGLTLSFGLMIVSVVQSPENPDATVCTTLAMQINGDNVSGGCALVTMFGSPNNEIRRGIVDVGSEKWIYNVVSIAGMKMFFQGQATAADLENIQASTNNIRGGISAVGGIFGTLIVDIIALIFIWMAFMAGKGVSKAVSAAVEPFEKMGQQIGGLASSLPKYAPLPIPGGSIAGAGKAVSQIQGIQENIASQRYKDSGVGKFISSFEGSSKLNENLNTLVEEIRTSSTSPNVVIEKTKALFEQASGQQIKTNADIASVTGRIIEVAKDSKNLHILQAKIGNDEGRAIQVIADSKDIKEADKKILIAAVIKKIIEARDIKDEAAAKSKIGAATAGIDSAAGATTANPTTQNPGASGFTAKQAADKDNNLIIDIGGVQIDITKTGDGIEASELEKLKSKVGIWTAEEFDNNLKSGGISTTETRKKIIDAVSKIKDGDKEFFKKKETPST